MTELLQAAVAGANIIPTILLVFVLLYWVAVIFGLLDVDFFDVELELEQDYNVDATQGVAGVAWLNSALAFFNLGRIPLMIFVTFLVLPLWVLSILANYYLNNTSLLVGLGLLVPVFVASLFVAKVLTMPFVKMFDALEREEEATANIIGQICTVSIKTTPAELGQATVKLPGGIMLLNVKSSKGNILEKGATALVIDFKKENNLYLIEPYQTI